jgi:hypothetical protein
MIALGEAPQALSKPELLKQLEGPLKQLFRERVDRQIEVDRFYQVALALRNELFWRGKQHLALSFSQTDGSLSWDSDIPGGDPENHQQVLRYHFNITRADGQKFISVVGDRAPHATVDPTVPEDALLSRKAKRANAGLRYLNDFWNADARQRDVARIVWKTGPAFLYTHWVSSGDLYGWVEEPVIEQSPVEVSPGGYKCPACGDVSPDQNCASCGRPLGPVNYQQPQQAMAPKVVDTKKYPKGAVHLDVVGILNVIVPRGAATIKECERLRYEREMSRAAAYAQFTEELGPDFLKSSSTAYGQDSGAQSAGQVRAQLETVDAIYRTDPAGTTCKAVEDWLRPSYYAYLEDEPLRSQLLDQFPDGTHVIRIDDKLVDVLPGKIDDEWSVVKTGMDDRILCDALCNDLVPINEILNNFWNLALQTVLQSIPKTMVASSLFAPGVLERPIVGEIIPVKATVGTDLSKSYATLPTARFSDQLMPLAESIRGMSREIDGVMEAIFGGGPTTQTWREAEQRKNQAMMQLSSAFKEMVVGWKGAYANGLRLLGEHGIDVLHIPPDSVSLEVESAELDMELLDMDGLFVNVNEAVPMTLPEEREQMIYMLTQMDPETRQALGLMHPASIPRIQQLLGQRGIYCPGENERAKVMEIIRQLLQQPPIQQIDQMTGMMIEVPAIMPDPVLDDSPIMYELAKAWCNSAGLEAQKTNPQGFQHVRLYAQAQQQVMQAQMAPPPMEGGPSPGPPGGAQQPAASPPGSQTEQERMAA